MSDEIEVHSAAELKRVLQRDLRALERKFRGAARRAARKGVSIVKRNIPVAHGELRESVHKEGETIVVDAPHAAPVNNGSRPHWAPLGPIVAWVKLRGMQGLASERQRGRLPGTSTGGAAAGVAAMLAGHERRGATNVDAAVQVARAIQHAIAKRGTKPHHFIEKSMPELYRLLDQELRRATQGKPSAGAGGGSGKESDGDGARTYHTGAKGGVYTFSKAGGKSYIGRQKADRLRDEGVHIHAYKPRSK